MQVFNVGKDFYPDPGGRYYSDGEGNGEDFRENYLKAALAKLAKDEKLNIILDDNVVSYGSSFLSEGFAGMVKYGYISAEELINKLEFVYSDPDFRFYEDRIIDYINKAKYNSKPYVKSKSE